MSEERIKLLEEKMRSAMSFLIEVHCGSYEEDEIESVWSDHAAWAAYMELKDGLREAAALSKQGE